MTRQTTIRLTPATDRQIAELQSAGFGTVADVIRISIDRMHQQEKHTMSTDRTAEVNELRRIADVISYYESTDGTAEELVSVWEELAPDDKPEWFTGHDRQLLVRFVEELIA